MAWTDYLPATRGMLRKSEEKTMAKFGDLNTKLDELGEKAAKGFSDIRADLKRLSDAIAAGEPVTPEQINAAIAKVDALGSAFATLVTDVDTTADSATGTQDDAPPPLPTT